MRIPNHLFIYRDTKQPLLDFLMANITIHLHYWSKNSLKYGRGRNPEVLMGEFDLAEGPGIG
jgi:hypothetical protein